MTIIKNHLLFNHTYLRQLQGDSSVDDQAADVAQGVRDWYEFRDTSSTQSLITSWVEPMLSLLELTLQPLSSATLSPSGPAPYLLYTAYNLDMPIGLCYVTPPGGDLDSTTKGSHWMAQAVLAARGWQSASDGEGDKPEQTIHNSLLRWVILTNGDQWRLLDAQSLRRYEAYLQVDLGKMARDRSDLTALRVFYRCFHRTAFSPNSNNERNLEHLLTESNHATERAERHLKQKMERMLGNLCRGFVAADGKTTYSETERDTIFADATYLLYRILFIFYAESRGLLPVEQAEYRQIGMQALAEQARRYKLEGIPDLQATSLWDQLSYLCDAIYGAEHEPENELGIPAYDGDLFDNTDHPYLAYRYITDQYLTDAIFDLGFLPADQAYRPLDYRDLSVRHLGSLYEGMLEYKLFVAEQPMLARRDDKGNISYLHREQAGGVKKTDYLIEPGEVYFSQSPGERRATGSYYTPEYIVDYIVKQTVWAGLSERRQPLEARLARWQTELTGALDEAERTRLQRTIDQELLNFVKEQVFSFRVCDPAMGSGHFLVNATLTIANFIVETLHLDFTPDALLTPNPHSLTTDPLYWRRQLVERCIYGVDLNPLAVELAKLSLWFLTVAWGKPLSFLNHHLRHGNSLVGTRLEELVEVLAGKARTSAKPSQREKQAQAVGQISMFDDPAFSQHLTTATHLLERITTQVAETVAEVKAQAGDYEQVRDELAPYRHLADILTARHFGLAVDEKQLKEIAKYLSSGADSLPAFQRLLQEAQTLAKTYNCFHWELEFPEVFLETDGQLMAEKAGFQAVIGNPPYIRQEELTPIKPYFASNYPRIYYGTADIFIYFFGQGLRLLQEKSRLAFISSNSWLKVNYAQPLRTFLRTEVTIEKLVDLGDNRAFPDVPDVYPAIPVVRRELPPSDYAAKAAVFSRGEGLAQFDQSVDTKFFSVRIHNQPDSGWQLEDDAIRRIFSKLMVQGKPLGEIVNGRIYSGIKTGLNKAFVIEQNTYYRLVQADPMSAQNIKPYLRGEDMRPWFQRNEGFWLILFPFGWTKTTFGNGLSEDQAWKKLSKQYPALAEYLGQFAESARKRQDQGDYWWELRPCDYYDEFEKPKILWPDIARYPRFSWDTSGFHVGNTGYITVKDDPWLLGYLGSQCAWFLISQTSIAFGERAGVNRYRLIDQYMRPLGVPNTPSAEKTILGTLAMSLTEQARKRYNLHYTACQHILVELGSSDRKLNQKLTNWWELSFLAFRQEIHKALKVIIPTEEHKLWQTWLATQQVEHERLTTEIVRLEEELNDRVYALFDLTPAEIRIIEESTKYRYGEV